MKRLFVMICVLGLALAGFAQDYSPIQERLRKEIAASLREKGLSPQNQSDGLMFRKDGNTYYVEIDENAHEPMYVRLRRYIKYDGGRSKRVLTDNLNEYNQKYGIKAFCQENRFVLSAEMFVTNAEEFMVAFDSLMRLMNNVYALLPE